MKKSEAPERLAIKETFSDMCREYEGTLTWPDALRQDADAFLRIAQSLGEIWADLVICANDPDYYRIHLIAADLYCVLDDAKDFAAQTQEDIQILERKETKKNEPDPVNR